jgi:hypothetical protein
MTPSETRRAWRAVLVLTMLVVLLGFGAASAQAHSVTIFHPNEPTYATLYTDHTSMWVCDQDADGHRAYIRFYIGGVLQRWGASGDVDPRDVRRAVAGHRDVDGSGLDAEVRRGGTGDVR